MTEPLLDIIIPVHNQGAWVDLCVRAVEHHTKAPFRLILVDNASDDEPTLAILRSIRARGHTVLRLPENRSFANSVNAGVAAGSARTIVVLNDDALVTEAWDGAMLQDVANRDVGLVGARSNYAAGAQGNPALAAQGDPPWLVFVCVALRREVWTAVGPMDEVTFDGWSGEDIDYSWRVVKAGYRLKVGGAFVLHAGSRTLLSTLGAGALTANNQLYQDRLLEKWGRAWVTAHTPGQKRIAIVSFHYNEYCLVAFKDAMLTLKYADVPFAFNSITRAPIDFARMKAADYALDNGYDRLVMLDDDGEFPPDLLRRFLAHDKEVVTALAYQRKAPHAPCIFADGDDGQLLTTPIMDAEHTGLRRVSRSGLHVAMVKTSVFQKMRDAGIREYFGLFDGKVGEDMAFSLNCRKVGVPLYCDTNLIAAHFGGPTRVDGAYHRAYRLATAPAPAGPQPAQIDGVPLVVER